jgi:hypothetical protein
MIHLIKSKTDRTLKEDLRATNQYVVAKTIYKENEVWTPIKPAKFDDKIEAGTSLDLGHDSKGKGCARINGSKPGQGCEIDLSSLSALIKKSLVTKH